MIKGRSFIEQDNDVRFTVGWRKDTPVPEHLGLPRRVREESAHSRDERMANGSGRLPLFE